MRICLPILLFFASCSPILDYEGTWHLRFPNPEILTEPAFDLLQLESDSATTLDLVLHKEIWRTEWLNDRLFLHQSTGSVALHLVRLNEDSLAVNGHLFTQGSQSKRLPSRTFITEIPSLQLPNVPTKLRNHHPCRPFSKRIYDVWHVHKTTGGINLQLGDRWYSLPELPVQYHGHHKPAYALLLDRNLTLGELRRVEITMAVRNAWGPLLLVTAKRGLEYSMLPDPPLFWYDDVQNWMDTTTRQPPPLPPPPNVRNPADFVEKGARQIAPELPVDNRFLDTLIEPPYLFLLPATTKIPEYLTFRAQMLETLPDTFAFRIHVTDF